MILVSKTKWIIDWIFPPSCIACGREGSWMCLHARTKLLALNPARVDVIEKVPAYVLGSYDDPVLGTLIRALKYRGWHALRPVLRDVVQPIAAILPRLLSKTTIVPIPLHPRRRRERGFNQSLCIAQALADVTGWPMAQLVTRQRYTRPQVGLAAELRQTNIRDAFRLTAPIASIPKCVILVDDVITTGATMHECAKVLRQAGVNTIIGLALAKG